MTEISVPDSESFQHAIPVDYKNGWMHSDIRISQGLSIAGRHFSAFGNLYLRFANFLCFVLQQINVFPVHEDFHDFKPGDAHESGNESQTEIYGVHGGEGPLICFACSSVSTIHSPLFHDFLRYFSSL
jgi:hypothetical protein